MSLRTTYAFGVVASATELFCNAKSAGFEVQADIIVGRDGNAARLDRVVNARPISLTRTTLIRTETGSQFEDLTITGPEKAG